MSSAVSTAAATEVQPLPIRHPRYPGPRSFADNDIDRHLFFGRETETEILTHRVRAKRLLVLFSIQNIICLHGSS